MQIRVFAIPMDGDPEATDELNAFLRGQKVLCVDKSAVVDKGRHFWSICVEYLPRRPAETNSRAGGTLAVGKPRIDYREILSPIEFSRYARLRELRKQLADAEAVPVYTIVTNAQLADIARAAPLTKTALQAIDGIGPAKAERYGEAFLALLRTLPAREPADLEPSTDAAPFAANGHGTTDVPATRAAPRAGTVVSAP